MKNENKLKDLEPLLSKWIRKFESDYNYKLISSGIEIVIIETIRDLETQMTYLKNGKSKTLKSKHLANKNKLSQALDIAFQKNGKIDWNCKEFWILAQNHFVDYFKSLNIKVTWGGDWNKNGEWKDEKFLDMPHFQLDNTPENDEYINTLIKIGDTGEIVKTIQSLLIKNGYNLGKNGIDGIFGKNTQKFVLDFQIKNGLKNDGIVGYKTLEKLKGV